MGKTFDSFLLENPRVTGVDPNPNATPAEKELVRKDVDKKRAVARAAKVAGANTNNYAQQVSAIAGDANAPLPTNDPTPQDAARFDLERAPGGRAASDPLKTARAILAKKRGVKASQLTPQDDAEIIDAYQDQEEGDRIRAFAMPDGPERDAILQQGQRRRQVAAARVAGAQGKLTGDFNRNVDVDAAVERGVGATAQQPFSIGDTGIEVKSIPGFRHLSQAIVQGDVAPESFPDPQTIGPDGKWTDSESGLEYHHDGENWRQVMSADDALTLVANTRDTREPGKLVKDKDGVTRLQVTPIGKPWGENPQNPVPSAAEMDIWNAESLDKAFEEGKIDKATHDRAVQLQKVSRPGTPDYNPAAIQDISFTRYAGEEGERTSAIDDVIGSLDLQQSFIMSGLGGNLNITDENGKTKTIKRTNRAYGGDLGEAGEKYRVPGSPDGVYDLEAMQKKDKKLYQQAIKNRLYEMVRTWLKQDGENAYSWWEGKRSINDMNLEHIANLAGGGWDHPDNWVWAGEELNKFKNEYDIPSRTETMMDPAVTADSPVSGKGWTKLMQDMKSQGLLTAKEIKELKGQIPALTMSKQDYNQLPMDVVNDYRDIALAAGIPKAAVMANLPNPSMRPGYRDNEEEFEAWRLKKEKDRQEEEKAANSIRALHGLPSMDAAMETPDGQELKAKLALRAAGKDTSVLDNQPKEKSERRGRRNLI